MRTSHMHLHFPTQSCPRWHCRNALLHLTENVCYATLFHLPCTMSSPFIGELMPQQSGENSCHLSPATNKTKCMHVIRALLSPHQNKWRGNAKKRVPITLARSPDYYSKGACWRDVRTPVCLNFHEMKIKGSPAMNIPMSFRRWTETQGNQFHCTSPTPYVYSYVKHGAELLQCRANYNGANLILPDKQPNINASLVVPWTTGKVLLSFTGIPPPLLQWQCVPRQALKMSCCHSRGSHLCSFHL